MATKKITLEYLKTEKGKLFLEKNKNALVWIKSDNGKWRPGGCGYTDYWAEAGVYSLWEAYSSTSHCGKEKQVTYHYVDESIIRNAIVEKSNTLYRLTQTLSRLHP